MLNPRDPRLARLKALVEERAVLHGDFTLASGLKSTYYFDGRRVTHDPEGITLIGALVDEMLAGLGVDAIGGPSVAANPIITATQIAAFGKGRRLGGFFIRGEQKQHGTQQLIEGNLPREAGARVALVDDTLTTGGSLERSIEAVEKAGCRVAKVITLVDRQQGGAQRLRQRGYDFQSILLATGDKIELPG